MGLAVIHTRAMLGMQAPQVRVEVNVAKGIGNFQIIGMPETTVREAKDRVRTAIINSGFEFPVGRITVNLSPAELPKQGARYDLAIALGVLMASEKATIQAISDVELYGELGLAGELRPVQGTLPSLLACQAAERVAVIPTGNTHEASLLRNSMAYACNNLSDVVAHLSGESRQQLVASQALKADSRPHGDMLDVRGQAQAKRALLLAAAGGHNLLFVGPPGTGKTMLAQRMLGILPSLSEADSIEVAAIQSLSREGFKAEHWRQRPLRSPHHSCSAAALVGGGAIPQPGEITLAHKGILFLDELAEIPRHILDSLREPLESGMVHISRAQQRASFPAQFQLLCALNPSPCGTFDGDLASARATPDQILKYLSKISGPFLDRIDIQVEVPRQPQVLRPEGVSEQIVAPDSAQLKAMVVAAQQRQQARQGKLNQHLAANEVLELCRLSADDHEFLISAVEKLKLSHRAYHRVLRLSRTIADLDGASVVIKRHVGEALSYRALDNLLAKLQSL